jgi:hypothetical protein
VLYRRISSHTSVDSTIAVADEYVALESIAEMYGDKKNNGF